MLSINKPVLILASALTLLTTTSIFAAEDGAETDNTQPIRVQLTVAQVRQERIYNLQEKREAQRATHEAKIASREARLEEHRVRIEEKKASASAEIKAKREAFQEHLAKIKDERKQKILEHLVTRYAHINERWTTHFLHVLDRLSQILDKLEMRMQEAADKGVDTNAVPEAITVARAAITDAQTVVENQAAKVYTIEISLRTTESPSADAVGDETTLRNDASAVHETLRADLTATRSTAQAAREAVHAVFQALKNAVVAHSQTNQGEPVSP